MTQPQGATARFTRKVFTGPALVVVRHRDFSNDVTEVWVVDLEGRISSYGKDAGDAPSEVTQMAEAMKASTAEEVKNEMPEVADAIREVVAECEREPATNPLASLTDRLWLGTPPDDLWELLTGSDSGRPSEPER